MVFNLKESKPRNKTLISLAIAASILSVLTVLVGDFVLPLPAALLAVIFVMEKEAKKRYSTVVSIIALASNALSLFFLDGFMLGGVQIVLFGIVISYCFTKDVSKADAAFILSIASALFFIVNAIGFAMSYSNTFDISAVKSFYVELYDLIKVEFLDYFTMLSADLQNSGVTYAITAEQVSSLLDSLLSLSVSFIAIIAFVLSGIALKIFSVVSFNLSGNKDLVYKWRFMPSSIFAYFYLALCVLTAFLADGSTLFSIAAINLSNIFCVVFAYVGFNFVLSLLSVKKSVGFSFVLLVIGLVIFSSLMVEILSIVGALVIVTGNKKIKKN